MAAVAGAVALSTGPPRELVSDVVRVLLADDHPTLVEGLRRVIDANDDLRVVAAANDADAAVGAALEHGPDVIVLDISVPGGGLQALRRLRAAAPNAKVVMLTLHTEGSCVQEAVRLGAWAHVPKRGAERDLLDAIRAAARGEAYLAPGAARMLLVEGRTDRPVELSMREREVFSFTARGLTNREIGERLKISAKTVDTYRARAMTKLGLHHRAEVVSFALGHGLMDPG